MQEPLSKHAGNVRGGPACREEEGEEKRKRGKETGPGCCSWSRRWAEKKGERALTKDQIERYGGICDQITALRAVKVRDTVQGSGWEIPYRKRAISVEGGAEEGGSSRLQALLRQKAAIEAAVRAVPEERDQAILTMRVLGRLTWNEIAGKLGPRYTVEGLKKIYQRALKKYF